MAKCKLKLDWCSHEAAKYAVENWHYSKRMPVFKLVKIGVWEDDVFIGVVLFGSGAAPNLVRAYGLKNIEGCELVRIALNKHKSPVSQIVSIAIKMLKKQSPGLRLIVSFADAFEKHHGGIYQAGNWVYAGLTEASKSYEDNNGRSYHQRSVSKTGFVKTGFKYRQAPKPSELKIIERPGKYRYLYPLDKPMRRQILPLSQPYPKQLSVGSIDNDALVNPDRNEGGANPTPTLQNIKRS